MAVCLSVGLNGLNGFYETIKARADIGSPGTTKRDSFSCPPQRAVDIFHHTTKEQRYILSERMKNPDDELKLVIVFEEVCEFLISVDLLKFVLFLEFNSFCYEFVFNFESNLDGFVDSIKIKYKVVDLTNIAE